MAPAFGRCLSADEGDGPWPVLLARTPYDNTLLWDVGCFWAQNGYVYVAQDVRGRYDSDGAFVPWDNETEDGYDTLEWIGQQPWCDGNVGMTGGSYLGQVQWQAAFTQHPLLKAICPRVMGNNLWDSPHYQDGAFGLGVNAVWGWRTMGRTTAADRQVRLAGDTPHPAVAGDGRDHRQAASGLRDLARSRGLRRLLARDRRRRAFRAVHDPGPAGLRLVRPLRRRDDGEFRRSAGSTPATTWRGQNQQIIMGPWTHPQAGSIFPPGTTNAGDRDFGVGSLLDTKAIELAWFDHWLKGVDNGAEKRAPVTIFVMGADTWRDEQEWPLARTEWTPYYLHSGGAANTLYGDGGLGTEEPAERAARQLPLRPGAPGPDTRRLQLLQPGGRPVGRLRSAAGRSAGRRPRLHDPAAGAGYGGDRPGRGAPLCRDRRPGHRFHGQAGRCLPRWQGLEPLRRDRARALPARGGVRPNC